MEEIEIARKCVLGASLSKVLGRLDALSSWRVQGATLRDPILEILGLTLRTLIEFLVTVAIVGSRL